MDERTGRAEQLQAVDAGSSAGLQIGRATQVHDALYGAAVGVLVAAMLAVVTLIHLTGAPWLAAPIALLFGLVIGVGGAIYRLRRSGSGRVAAQLFRLGFFTTFALYALGVLLSMFVRGIPIWFWIPYLLATALPLVLTSAWGSLRDH